jgi:hypothetical protein
MPSGFEQGGGIYCFDASSPIVLNSIVWGNVAKNEIYLSENSSINITYSDIEGGWDGNGNIDADPLYVNSIDSVPDYHLTASSPGIDTGTSEGAPTDDIDDDPRPQGIGFDIGADEVILKDSDGDGVSDVIDQCPNSALSQTIVIGECNTGVANEISDDGCTRQDLINGCINAGRNKGAAVMCVAHLTNVWKRKGLITGNEKGKIQRCAAKIKRKISKIY